VPAWWLVAAGLLGVLVAVALTSPKLSLVPFVALLSAVAVVTGGLVNPTVRGIKAVTSLPLYQAVRAIQENSPGTWLAADGWIGDFLITAGAPTVDSTNTIPNLALWSLVDPDGKQASVYNRYAHVAVELTAEPTSFELTSPDAMLVHLNPADLLTLGVNYVVTRATTELSATDRVSWTVIYEDATHVVYRVEPI